MKEESLLLLSDLQKLINQVVLIDYTIIILGGKLVLLINTDKKGKKQAYQMKFYQKYFTSCFNPRRILSRTRLGSTPSTSAILFTVIPR